MPSFLVRKVSKPDYEKETLEEALERVASNSNANFQNLKRLLQGNMDFINTDSGGMLQTWQDSNEDNVDDTEPMLVDLYLPPEETRRIHKVILRLRLKEFRAYSRAASTEPEVGRSTEGGGSIEETTEDETLSFTSGPSNEETTESGEESLEITGTVLFGGDPVYILYTSSEAEHNHGLTDHTHNNPENDPSGEHFDNHSHDVIDHGHLAEIDGHVHGMDHTHLVEDTHSHWVEVGDHYHYFVVPEHDHDIIHGLYQDPFPTDPGVQVAINDTDRTSELGGPFHISEPKLDITEWIERGWNTIKFTPGDGKLLRLQATVFVQAFIEPVDHLEPEER